MATRPHSGGRLRATLALAALAMACALPSPAAAQDSLEYTVKAAYISKLGNFVGWPASAVEASGEPFDVCVVGDDPFGAKLDETVRGQRIDDRPIVVRRLASVTRDSGCEVAYVGGSEAQPVAAALEAMRGANVLTITDAAQQSGAVGIVHFVIKDDRVRFDIDDQAASENGLTISSELLKLALSVKRRS